MKLCKECKFAYEGGGQIRWNPLTGKYTQNLPWLCGHPEAVEPINGKVAEKCGDERALGGRCGPDGARWEAGEPKPMPEVPLHLRPPKDEPAFVEVPVDTDMSRPWSSPTDAATASRSPSWIARLLGRR